MGQPGSKVLARSVVDVERVVCPMVWKQKKDLLKSALDFHDHTLIGPVIKLFCRLQGKNDAAERSGSSEDIPPEADPA